MMADFWADYLFPLIIMVAQSVLLLVALLLIVAYILYADRKVWAAAAGCHLTAHLTPRKVFLPWFGAYT